MGRPAPTPGAAEALARIRVVLVGPLYGGNVGSACRAMKNMGLRDLVIAAPAGPLDEDEGRIMACHAKDIFAARREAPTVAEAVADCGLVAGTTARPGLYRAHARTPRDWAPRLLEAAADAPVALVFGPEDRGLSNEELAPCTQLIQIPSSPAYPSLNLAQAVLICAYELFVAAGTFRPPRERSPEAPSALRERMFALWRESLLDCGFMQQENADHMMLGLRRILARGPLTEADCNILMGIARQSQWAARQAGLAAPREPQSDGRPATPTDAACDDTP